MGIPGSEFRSRYIDRQVGKWLMLKKQDSGECAFLTRAGGLAKCSIYEVRPETCRRFPWLAPMIMTGSKWPGVLVSDELCPRMSATFAARMVTESHRSEASGEPVAAEYDSVGGGTD
jgi:Fe-S-cluster containining protein